jgi:Sec-independent protein secretion pathway component TatC
MISSLYGFRIPFNLDNNSGFGTKTIGKIDSQSRVIQGGQLFIGFVLLGLNFIIPIGLDTFDSYDEKTLTNLWSFQEVLSLESVLVTVLLTLSEIPIVVMIRFDIEKDINLLIEYWKDLSFFSFVAAGFITPTIDGYTQINLSISAIALYIFVIVSIKKRIPIKFNSVSSLNF